MRIGLAGGGSDHPTYCSTHGGVVVSAAIDLFAEATLTVDIEGGGFVTTDASHPLDAHGVALRTTAHDHMRRAYGLPDAGYRLVTSSDMQPGCGLGSSSSVVVAIVTAYSELFDLGLNREERAMAAWTIERERLGWFGGYQDQYAASFGGVHRFDFGANGLTGADELRDDATLRELESKLCLFDAGRYKASSTVETRREDDGSPDGRHDLREQAVQLWNDMAASDLSTLSKILIAAQRRKNKYSSPQPVPELRRLDGMDSVRGWKVCGSGPNGVAVVLYDGVLGRLAEEAARLGVVGRFRRVRIAGMSR